MQPTAPIILHNFIMYCIFLDIVNNVSSKGYPTLFGGKLNSEYFVNVENQANDPKNTLVAKL